MEIHKPKPIHNWREFLKEVGIIVLGVGIALAAEQAVEWMHWQSEVKTARQAIYREIAGNNVIYGRRLAFAPCLDRQADEAQRILDELEANQPPGRFITFHTDAHFLLNESEWQSERSAQSLTHFPRAELALMGSHYALLPLVRDWLDREAGAWRALNVLRKPPKEIAHSDLLRMREALETARWAERLIVLNAGRQLHLGRQLGIAGPPPDARVGKFCTLDHEPYMQWVRSLEPPR